MVSSYYVYVPIFMIPTAINAVVVGVGVASSVDVVAGTDVVAADVSADHLTQLMLR